MILDLLFPPKCYLCGKYGNSICIACLNKLPKRNIHYFKLGNIKKVFASYQYSKNKSIKKIIKNIKYRFLYGKITPISETMYQTLKTNFYNKKIILVPVPLHWKRLLGRGFNQAEILSNSIQKFAKQNHKKHIKTLNLISRIKNTKPQSSLKKNERLNNLTGAFKIIKNIKLNKDEIIILVDDIVTTGETLRKCANEISKYFNNDIYGLVIASDKK